MAYAWSTLTAQTADDKGRFKKFNPGDEVNAGDLGLDDEEFDELLSTGAVREDEYPVPANFDGSPVEYRREQLRAAASEEFMAVLPFGSAVPITEPPPGASNSSAVTFEETSAEAVELTGFDPDVPPEQNSKEPEKSEQDKAAEADAKKAAPAKAAATAAPAAPASSAP